MIESTISLQSKENKGIYFISDLHLVIGKNADSRVREQRICKFLEEIAENSTAIFFLGDLFDFWYEYKYLVPRGFTRFLGTLAKLSDSGVKLYYAVGNHDQWHKSYFKAEFDCQIITKPTIITIDGQRYLIGHGHRLGTSGIGDRLLQWGFNQPFFIKLFGMLHPYFSFGFAVGWASKRLNRKLHYYTDYNTDTRKDEVLEYILKRQKLNPDEHIDYYVFGHRHVPVSLPLQNGSQYINIGEWIHACSYGVVKGKGLELGYYKAELA